MSNVNPLPADSSGAFPPAVTLAPQPHGGRLKRGNPGNVGSQGRPPSVVRARCRESFYDRINRLEGIADSSDAEHRDVIRAIDTLGRYGLTTGRLDVEEVRTRLARTIAKIEELADSVTAERLLTALDVIWNPNREGTPMPLPAVSGE